MSSEKLHKASYYGNTKQLEKLLKGEEKLDINCLDGSGSTALHHCSFQGRIDIVQILLSRKDINPNISNNEGSTPLHHAVFEGYIDVARLLIQSGADINKADIDGTTPLHIASSKGDSNMISFLLKNGAEVNKLDSSKNSPLHLAIIQLNDAECIRVLVNNGANVTIKNKNSYSPIHKAAYLGKEGLLDVLLRSKNSDVHLQDSEGYTALHLSILKKHLSTTKLILKYMQETNKKAVIASHNGSTPLHIASYLGESSIVELLIQITKCDVNTVDNRGMSALHYASLVNSLECVTVLLNHGAHPRLNSLNEHTPLDLANDPHIKKLLNEAKVEVENSIEETENTSIDEKMEIKMETIVNVDPTDKYGFSGRHPYVQTQRDLEYNKLEITRTIKWLKIINKWKINPKKYLKYKEKYRPKVYKGIPDSVRGIVWTWFTNVREMKMKYPTTYFTELQDKKPSRDVVEQIEKDLKRTFPTHVQFKDDIGQKSLYRVLHAFSLHNVNVGYCQGMGFVVALLLMYIPEEESAFWALVHIIDHYEMEGMWAQNLAGLKRAYFRLEKLMEEHVPKVLQHIEKKDLSINIIAPQYFLTVFLYNCVWPCCLRIWDIFLYEGHTTIYATAIALFLLNEKQILGLDFDELVPYLKFSHQMDHQTLTEKIAILVPAVKRRLNKIDKLFDKKDNKKPTNQK
eukprot:TRINITY_DN2392_c0_g1_i1.p1 TRINITY_DN2392_c0_g1~~TRINITY_DN2392_c0_g1_i1.p1  ORF type:complete len:686 (+),score=197.69 TRINITY_DN2392_c0_g1_i1:34-2091(+)